MKQLFPLEKMDLTRILSIIKENGYHFSSQSAKELNSETPKLEFLLLTNNQEEIRGTLELCAPSSPNRISLQTPTELLNFLQSSLLKLTNKKIEDPTVYFEWFDTLNGQRIQESWTHFKFLPEEWKEPSTK